MQAKAWVTLSEGMSGIGGFVSGEIFFFWTNECEDGEREVGSQSVGGGRRLCVDRLMCERHRGDTWLVQHW